jgi:hypothetical protein
MKAQYLSGGGFHYTHNAGQQSKMAGLERHRQGGPDGNMRLNAMPLVNRFYPVRFSSG